MRDLIDILETAVSVKPKSFLQTLLEGEANYAEMFAKIEQIIDEMNALGATHMVNGIYISQIIKFAKDKLKRPQRISWFLRIARLHVMWNVSLDAKHKLHSEDDYDLNQKIYQLNQEYITTYQKNFGQEIDKRFYLIIKSSVGWSQFLKKMEHYAGFPPEIFDRIAFGYKNPHDIFDEMKVAEESWAKKHAGLMPFVDDNRDVLKFPDGMCWVENPNGNCEIEGKAMGHCGNVGSYEDGETIFSLRRIKEVGSRKYWEVFLTFILDADSMMGEMKGRFNEKPDKKFHPYIIALLKEKYVEGVKGGGYKPENNFSLDDLTEEEREDLYRVKPKMMPFDRYLDWEGMDDWLAKGVRKILLKDAAHGEYGWNHTKENLSIYSGGISGPIWHSIKNLHIQAALEFHATSDFTHPQKLADFLNKLNQQQLEEVGLGNRSGTFTMDSIMSLDMDFRQILRTAVKRGFAIGTGYFYWDRFERALNEIPDVQVQTRLLAPSRSIDPPWIEMHAWLTAETACRIAGDTKLLENIRRNGWWNSAGLGTDSGLDLGEFSEKDQRCDFESAYKFLLS